MRPFGGACVCPCMCVHVYMRARVRAHVCLCVHLYKGDRLRPRVRSQPSSKWTETAGHSTAVGALRTLQSWLLYLGEDLVCAGQLSKVVLTSRNI